ncbi:MAG TPA: hypothetical protein VFU55_00160 [Terracidiphilus sp.]|nr:hypothetical protein [Terracidiphilus sp.]
MPEPEDQNEAARFPGQLNEPQQRRLRVTCRYIDDLLTEIEHALRSAASKSPFPRYVVDLAPQQTREIEDRIASLRAQLIRTLAWQRLAPEPPEIPVSRSVLTDLSYIDNAIEELKPRHLRGCGPVPPDAVDDLNAVIRTLQSMVQEFSTHVRQQICEEPSHGPE